MILCTRHNIFLMLLLFSLRCAIGHWWKLGIAQPPASSVSVNYLNSCLSLEFLLPKQQELCQLNKNILRIVSLGAKLGIEECQHHFRGSRWNCSLEEDLLSNNGKSIFGSVLSIKSREAAYVYAISSASVAFAVTRSCSKGELNECACDSKIRLKPRKWQWGGCSEDIHFGESFSRKFVDSIEDANTAAGLMNLHNNEAGRRAIRLKMMRVCKCHGMSGSCSVRVCWRRLPPMRVVGEELGRHFEGASHVKLIERRKGKKLKPLMSDFRRLKKMHLVYLEDSPDYCERNETLGVLGTHGRVCNQSSPGLDGCRLLCCGRGYQTRVRQVTEKCRCQFVWCCNVQCDMCTRILEEHVCN